MRHLGKVSMLVLAVIFITSCKDDQEQAKPQTEIVYLDKEQKFINNLELYYYGQYINIMKESKRIVGSDGKVEYKMYQAEKYDGTDLVNVDFNLSGGGSSSFSNLNFKLLINMVNQSVDEIEEAYRDGKKISSTNLVLLLGDW